ncbi:MAG: hypothetical protein DHS20C15_02920 [Planctomycetota bacterium]|nr:MAG: hypothetical protein DHS20C15_02920 [Planctomycetota bacterium]
MSRSLLLPALALAIAPNLCTSVSAQVGDEFAVLFSTSAAAELAEHPVSDQELLSHAPSEGTRIAYPLATLLPFFGENTSQVHTLPGDLDAVHDPGHFASDGELLLSFASDAQGFKDGDAVRLSSSGAEIAFPEQLFVLITGASDDNVDLDALQVDADGALIFSFNENEDSTLLSGDEAGVIADGDVLRWETGAGQAELLFTESEIDAMVSAALGVAVSTGDTKSLARHPQSGALLFSVQSPSAHDASVFSSAEGGSLLVGYSEEQLGFLDSEELDALSVRGPAYPVLRADELRPAAGSEVSVDLQGAEPGSLQLLLMSLGNAAPWVSTSGWGGVVLVDDPMFQHSVMVSGVLFRVADASGRAQWQLNIPLGFPALDVIAQSFELGSELRASNPILVEGGQ